MRPIQKPDCRWCGTGNGVCVQHAEMIRHLRQAIIVELDQQIMNVPDGVAVEYNPARVTKRRWRVSDVDAAVGFGASLADALADRIRSRVAARLDVTVGSSEEDDGFDEGDYVPCSCTIKQVPCDPDPSCSECHGTGVITSVTGCDIRCACTIDEESVDPDPQCVNCDGEGRRLWGL